MGAGFFVGEVADVAVAAALRVAVRLTVVDVVEVAVERRLVLVAPTELTREDEICLFAVSFICLSIIGDFADGTRCLADPRVDPVVAGAVFGLWEYKIKELAEFSDSL